MIGPNAKFHVFLWNPEVRKDHIFVCLIPWWEHEDKSCDICRRRQVEASVTDASLKLIEVFGDIRQLVSPPKVDYVVGGWPCQDLSSAGVLGGIMDNGCGLNVVLDEDEIEIIPTDFNH